MHPALLLFISLSFAALAWRDLRFALVLLAGLLPTYLLRFSIGPLPSTLLEVLVLICVMVWLVAHNGWRMNLRQTDAWTRAGLLLLAAASFAVVVAPDTISALGVWKAYFVEPFLVFLMLRSTLNHPQPPSTTTTTTASFINQLLLALAISGIASSLFAIFQVTTGIGIPVPWDTELRATGFFDYPNALGLFLTPIVTMSIIFARTKHGSERWIWIASVLLGYVAIILAQTEASLVTIPASLTVAFLFTSAPKQKKWLAVGLGSTLLAIALLIPMSRSKLLLQDYSGGVRRAQWSETIQMLAHNPAFGAGLNAYPEALVPYHDPTMYEIFQYPHNIFLNIWTELGLLGLVAFFWLVWLTLKQARTLKNPQRPSTALKLAILAALIAMAIHGLVDVPYFKNDLSIMTWIFIAILATRLDETPATD